MHGCNQRYSITRRAIQVCGGIAAHMQSAVVEGLYVPRMREDQATGRDEMILTVVLLAIIALCFVGTGLLDRHAARRHRAH